MVHSPDVESAYKLAREQYSQLQVDTDHAIDILRKIPISLHCWQGDDVGGFENPDALAGGGIQATGNYPGKARTPDQLRSDLEQALRLIPGRHRLNLHAFYAETNGKKVDRDQLAPEHFSRWLDWAKTHQLGLDFNPTYFAHPLAASGFTLSSSEESIRQFWVRHGIACRNIGEHFGRQLQNPCVTNNWIPDGYKDIPADRASPRLILKRSLDELFAREIDPRYNLDAVEGKLFGLGLESYTVGSHEFYLAYAAIHKKLVCLDMGHYHPTEQMSDKLSSILANLDTVLLHVSRGVRWDSDHIVLLSDELRDLASEIIRGGYIDRVKIGLDFFDASVNRIAAWVIGTRSMCKALLIALLEPTARLKEAETTGDYTTRLALLEETKTMPFGAVWDYYCLQADVPPRDRWLQEVKTYERTVLSKR